MSIKRIYHSSMTDKKEMVSVLLRLLLANESQDLTPQPKGDKEGTLTSPSGNKKKSAKKALDK